MNENIVAQNCIEEDEIDLRELFATIWSNKFKIIFFTFFVTSLTILYVMYIPNSYKSTTVLAPQEQSKSMGLGGLSALAGFAGINIGGGNMDAYNSLKAIIDDKGFERYMVKKYNLVNRLSIDSMDKHLVFALNYRGVYDYIHSLFNGENKKSPDEKVFDLVKKLKKDIISLQKDKKSGAITLSITLPDRFLAKDLVEIYLKESTNYLRKLDMADINKKIDYYKNELANVSDIELKTQISQLISALVQKRVLSNASEYYVVKQITKPEVAFVKDKAKPKRALIVIVAFITSIILSIFMVFFLEFLKNEKD